MNLQDYFYSIDLDKIHEFLDDKQEEHLQLDFKEVGDSSMDKNDRKVFGKTMSGFANSSGGVIIWGVEACRQNGEELDVACSLPMVKDATLLLNKLNEHTGTLVSPIVEGVIHEPIIANSEGAGFVKTLIPESLTGPHMSNREKVYYKRSGDSFYKMEHFDIADMFGKRRKPELKLSLRKVTDERRCLLAFGIENVGRGSAKSPLIGISVSNPYQRWQYGIDGNGNTGLPELREQARSNPYTLYGGNTNFIIHPDTRLEIDQFVIRRDIYDTEQHAEVKIRYFLASEDTETIRNTVEIHFNDMRVSQPLTF